ncbi:MAG: hypothetical protein J7L17_04015 [Thaumarchaeota archaeon]|nr:hypothetical protein [Nitrososphaerota archaeon]
MPRVEKLVIQVLCYATEDPKKVLKAVENVLGADAAKKMSMSSERLEGYYGDPITLMRIFLLDRELCEKVLLRILSNLSVFEREELWRDRSKLGRHGGKLYIRLDKQEAFLGRIRLSDKDPIRIVAELRGNVEALRKRLEEKLQAMQAEDRP